MITVRKDCLFGECCYLNHTLLMQIGFNVKLKGKTLDILVQESYFDFFTSQMKCVCSNTSYLALNLIFGDCGPSPKSMVQY